MSTEKIKSNVLRVFDEAFNGGNLSVIDETFAPPYVYSGAGMPEIHGPDGFKELVTMFRTAFPDLHIVVDDLIAENDKVVSRYHWTGTHLGELMGIPPTGKAITVSGIVISRVVEDKFVEDWEIIDNLGMLQQLGVVAEQG